MGISLTQTELEIMKQVDEHGGTLNLDLSDDLHYQYYVDCFGGEEMLKAKAPTFYEIVQYRRNYDYAPEKFSDLQFLDNEVPLVLEDYAMIANAGIDTYSSKTKRQCLAASDKNEEIYHIIHSIFEASYASRPTSSLNLNVRIIDIPRKEWIQSYGITLEPDKNHTYTHDISAAIEDDQVEREHPYRTMVTISGFSPMQDNGCMLMASVISSLQYSISTNEDIQEINLLDPRCINGSKRGSHKDQICISYKRSGNLEYPDYSYNVDMSSGVKEMPVHIDFAMTVKLRNQAYFRLDEQGSYFCRTFKPIIHLSRFDDKDENPVSEGRARLYQDWTTFTEKHIEVLETDANKHATKLKLTFPNEWDTNLTWDKVKNISTLADFYAMLSFNTCNKTTAGSYSNQTTAVFVRYQPNPKDRSNPTKPGKNNVHVPRLFYQWGCFGKDTILLGENGPVLACEVKLHDRLMSRDGKWIEVENIYSGKEESIFHIVHEKGDIFLTPDHTLFDENVTPMAAENVAAGKRLIYFDSAAMKEELVTVTKTETVSYADKVYNFEFAQPEYLIANGLLTGDYGWQQKVRPKLGIVAPVPINQIIQDALKELDMLSGIPEDINDITPVFSNKEECFSLHYLATKTLACCYDLFTEEEAQTIAEYCQYIGDNANIGALSVKSVPANINNDGLADLVVTAGVPSYLVPVIPTAMVKWYDDDELVNARTWTASEDSKYFKESAIKYSYVIPHDILAPFHYPFCSSESGTEYFSADMKKLMDQVAQHAAKQEKLDRDTLIAIGIVLHMFLDSLIHEGFYPSFDWRNLGRIEQIVDPNGKDITDKHKPYNPGGKPFPAGEYSEDTIYPAGIKENGDASQCSYVRYCYYFPMFQEELPLEAFDYSGYQNYENTSRYIHGCEQMMKFLVNCKSASGAVFSKTNWDKIIAPALERVFIQSADTQNDMQNLWKNEFTTNSYNYDKNAVFKRLTTGDTSKMDDKERYAEFFTFTLLIARIKKGADLFE